MPSGDGDILSDNPTRLLSQKKRILICLIRCCL